MNRRYHDVSKTTVLLPVRKATTSHASCARGCGKRHADVALRVEETDMDAFTVWSGELHLAILIETMRRKQNSCQTKCNNERNQWDQHEPLERVTVDVGQEYTGAVIEGLGIRKVSYKHGLRATTAAIGVYCPHAWPDHLCFSVRYRNQGLRHLNQTSLAGPTGPVPAVRRQFGSLGRRRSHRLCHQ